MREVYLTLTPGIPGVTKNAAEFTLTKFSRWLRRGLNDGRKQLKYFLRARASGPQFYKKNYSSYFSTRRKALEGKEGDEFTVAKVKYTIASVEKENTLMLAFAGDKPLVLKIVSLKIINAICDRSEIIFRVGPENVL